MRRIFMLAAAATLAATAAQAEIYAVKRPGVEAEDLCRQGADLIYVGDGEFVVGEVVFSRITRKKPLDGGWFEAFYSVETAGEPQEHALARMKMAGSGVQIQSDMLGDVEGVPCSDVPRPKSRPETIVSGVETAEPPEDSGSLGE